VLNHRRSPFFYYFDGGNVGSDPGNEGFPGKREAEKVKENQFIV
jgi:hypothetical protein